MKRWTRWTKQMNQFLLSNYKWIGDKHLADMFEARFPKHFRWTLKHIERRRSYMKLKRSQEAIVCIKMVNNLGNDQTRLWDKRGRSPEGSLRIWNGRKYIKVKGRFVSLGRHVTKAKKGQVAIRTDDGYQVISMAEHARINKQKSLQLPEDLRQAIKTLNQLKKLIPWQ